MIWLGPTSPCFSTWALWVWDFVAPKNLLAISWEPGRTSSTPKREAEAQGRLATFDDYASTISGLLHDH